MLAPLIGGAYALSALCLSSAVAAPAVPQVKLAQGELRGAVQDGVAVFRAIPYAAPPVGDLRFRPPQAPLAWNGVRDATQPGNSCPQGTTGDPAGLASDNEDCLLLNVFAPAAKGRANRPVMVWIHGGGFAEGFAGARQYDPAPLVREGGLVVVSINYRLATLGFLALKSLDEPNAMSGNQAIRDQQAALKWVKRNIAAFGGNPANVTIVGESAGASSVAALVASPLSKGLFQKAIAQSLPTDWPTLSREEMETRGTEIAVAAGCADPATQAQCLRRAPLEAILKVRRRLGLTRDSAMMPQNPFAAMRDGTFNRVPMIIGSNLHEGYFFASGAERAHAMTADEYGAQLTSNYGADAARIGMLYPLSAYPTPAAAVGDAIGDIRFACGAELARTGASRYVPVYGYELNETDPVQQQPRKQVSLANTDYHTTDLAYLFDYDTGPLTGRAAELGKKMRAYWIAFIKTGKPEPRNQPTWPAYRSVGGKVLNLSSLGGVTADFAVRHRCGALEAAGLVKAD